LPLYTREQHFSFCLILVSVLNDSPHLSWVLILLLFKEHRICFSLKEIFGKGWIVSVGGFEGILAKQVICSCWRDLCRSCFWVRIAMS
uniref:Uncharacterized protein n=1 Tax=Ficedula albicollis TaxID=59894 RepID=A0A803VE87_FICAL